MTEIELRAEKAMREGDYRIARKHAEQAAARPMTPANQRSYERAREWETLCLKRFVEARARLIEQSLGEKP